MYLSLSSDRSIPPGTGSIEYPSGSVNYLKRDAPRAPRLVDWGVPIYVANGASSGVVEFTTDDVAIFKATVNANESATEHHIGWVDNLKLVSMPTGAEVTVQIE